MTGVLKPRLEVLPPAKLQLLPELDAAAELGFALYGGTAIALRLGHRVSVDFDFFCERPLDRESIRNAFPFMPRAIVLQDRSETLTVLVPGKDVGNEPVKLSFFGTITIGRVGVPDVIAGSALQVASLDDLMPTKLKVLLQRAEAKDYRDVAAMLAAGVDLAHGLAAAREMFGPNFQPSECLKALVYFDDGDLSSLTPGERHCLVETVSAVRDLPAAVILSRQLTLV